MRTPQNENNNPVDLTGLFSGGSSSGGSTDLGGVLAGAAGSNGLGNTLAGIGNLTGIPGAGLVGAAVGAVAGLFGGGVGYGTTQFDGHHSPTLPRLEASSMKMGEVGIYLRHANGLGISVEEVDALFHEDAQKNGRTMKYILDAYEFGSPETLATWIPIYNAKNPQAPITRGELGPRSYAAAPSPVATYGNGFAGASLPSAGLGFSGSAGGPGGVLNYGNAAAPTNNPTTVGDWIKTVLQGAAAGAQDGAGTAIAGTSVGQQIKKDQINGFIKEYQLPLAGLVVGIGWLAVRAFKRS